MKEENKVPQEDTEEISPAKDTYINPIKERKNDILPNLENEQIQKQILETLDPEEKTIKAESVKAFMREVLFICGLEIPDDPSGLYEDTDVFDDFIRFLIEKTARKDKASFHKEELLADIREWLLTEDEVNPDDQIQDQLTEEQAQLRRESPDRFRKGFERLEPTLSQMFQANQNSVSISNLPELIKEFFNLAGLMITSFEYIEKADAEQLGQAQLVEYIQAYNAAAIQEAKEKEPEETEGQEPLQKKLSFKEKEGMDISKIDFETFYNSIESFIINNPYVVILEKPMGEEGPSEGTGDQVYREEREPTDEKDMEEYDGRQEEMYYKKEEEYREPDKMADYDVIKRNQHFYDGIETEEYIMPTKFEVEIHLADNQIKIVTVDVEKCQVKNPYIGGFRNKRNGIVFLNAFSQTDQDAKLHATKFHREVQTYQYKTKSSTMNREFHTQTEKVGLYIDKRDNKPMEAKPYFTSEMWQKRREEKTLFIQCMVRGWFARKKAAALRKIKVDKDMEIIRKEEESRKKEEENHKLEIERRMHPKSYQDFEILYNELEAWRANETQKIKETKELTEEEKHKALHQLLNKETKLLQTIDRLKITANSQNREERITKFLQSMAAPKLWKRSDERFTEVHTPFTTRAKELMDLYNGLKMPFLSIDERLDILLHTKWTVKEFDCHLTREIVDLIDREADMLNRGRSEKSLDGLRKRLCNLFLQFIETPEFNPEAARFQKVPRELLQQTQSNFLE